MIFTVASALMFVKKRSLFQVIPNRVKNVWNEWELRALILLSLTLQILLISLGKRRKYIARPWIRFTLWSAYLMADWIAIVALGVISNSVGGGKGDALDRQLMSFWAPFLLLHLGGPDTITSYSLEDNALWLRHLLGLVVQTGVAMYVFLMAWPGNNDTWWLPILSIPMFEAGLIKYGERTWALRLANTENLRESMLTHPDPGPNYAKFMEEFTLKKAQGFYVKAEEVKETSVPVDHHLNTDSRHEVVLKAYDLFQTFKRLFVDLILSFQDRDTSEAFFRKLTPETAFHVIEIELGFAFDVFYTKAPVVYTVGGCVLRLVSFSSTFSVLVAFFFLCKMDKYHPVDMIITYLLLVAALVLEIYAVILMLRSDWTDHWRSKNKRTRNFLVLPCLQPSQAEKQWWSNSMAQYNLLSFCLRDIEKREAACLSGIQRLLQIDELKEKYMYRTHNNVSVGLKTRIFSFFLEYKSKDKEPLCTHRGSFALNAYKCTSINWSVLEVEFDQSILIWHIATDLCYYTDSENTENKEESKHISDYMLYLLVMCPFLLPIGIGMIRFQDTIAEAREFFGERGPVSSADKAKACEKLLQVNTEVPPSKVKGDRSKSVLFDACRLAKSLQAREEKEKWRVVSGVWVEMLANAATHCRGNHHAQQLRKGGEFLTHVWLLVAHLGITEQFQINQGHARAKLMVK